MDSSFLHSYWINGNLQYSVNRFSIKNTDTSKFGGLLHMYKLVWCRSCTDISYTGARVAWIILRVFWHKMQFTNFCPPKWCNRNQHEYQVSGITFPAVLWSWYKAGWLATSICLCQIWEYHVGLRQSLKGFGSCQLVTYTTLFPYVLHYLKESWIHFTSDEY